MVAIANNSLQASVAKSGADARTLLLSFIRVATIRAKLAVVDLDSIGIALKHGVISLDGAIAWLDDACSRLLFGGVTYQREVGSEEPPLKC
jgi:hypothetical protein